MGTEKLKFTIELFATMWDKPPHATVSINENIYFNDFVKGTETKPTVINFEHDCIEGKDQILSIKRSNKLPGQTVINEKGDILKDQLLHIKRMEIDDIDLGPLVYTGLYTPNYPEPWATEQLKAGHDLPESFTNVTDMGHDGVWEFSFGTPFYMWLLENLY